MRSIIEAGLGGLLSFSATLLAIGAAVLFVAGVGGGILVRERPGTARILKYDASNVVQKAAATGVSALLVAIVFVAVYIHLRRVETHRSPPRCHYGDRRR